jgi:hypothetical protein
VSTIEIMATKAERFRAEAERSAQPKRPPTGGHLSAGLRAARRGRTKNRLPNPTSHNEAPSSKKNSVYQIEYDTTSRPPRKSSRGSPTHIKTDSPLRIRAMNQAASPRARAGR